MTLETGSRGYTQNLRKFRRYLQGRGVNLRETIVSANAYADVRITVPGLHDDDAIISVINMTDMLDVTGYLDNGGEFATVDIFSTNKGIRFTALKAGTEGNKIYVKAAAAPGNSLPLSVAIGAYDVILGTTGNPGKTAILVSLATNSSGVALTTGENDASLVFAAIIDAQEQMIGDAIVDLALLGDGTTDWTATGPTALTGGTSFKQGPSTAKYVTAFTDPYADGNVRYVARQAGAEGNDITIEYTDGGALAVDVTTEAIVVTYVVGVTTAQDVVDAVNANADAAALVIASLASVDAPDGLVETLAQTNLTGGADPGIQLSAATDSPLAAKSLKVLWLTRDERDEMPAQ